MKEIIGYDHGYSIKKDGTVLHHRSGKTLRNEVYVKVRLMKKGKPVWVMVHRLLAEAFIPNPQKKPFVNHINGLKYDNRLENLEWVTHLENVAHAKRMGFHNIPIGLNLKGVDHPCAKLNDKKVRDIRLKYKEGGTSTYKLAKEYGVSRQAISSIVRLDRWKHVV